MTNINNENAPPPVNAEAQLSISPDALEASILIKPPENNGANLSYRQLKDFLTKGKIIFGTDEAALINLSENPVYNKNIVIANGVPPENGEDAELVYYIETDRKIKPKEKADGSVDFKDLGMIQDVKQGLLLCEKKAATPGKNGTDVKGMAVRAVPGKDMALPAGQNTLVSEDKLKLTAALDGHVTFAGGKISVLNTFVIEGNVSVETGNIDFSGNVLVRGDVAQGYIIKATGDVIIDGTVEAAEIKIGGDLIIKGGFLGSGTGKIETGGNATCRFIEGGRAEIKGNLETTYIMNAVIKCGGAVNLVGKGLIRGSYVSAGKSVTAGFIGAPKASAINTVIEIGADPFLTEKSESLTKEAEDTKKNISNLELVITPLEKARLAGSLSVERYKHLEKANLLLATLKQRYKEVQEEAEKIKQASDTRRSASINVKQTAHTGTKIVIGAEMLILQTDHDRVTFYRDAEGITFVPLLRD